MENIRKIMISVNRIDGLYYLLGKKLGLKENTFQLLYALSDGKAYSQKQISKEWLVPKTTINTVVKECVDNGYIILKKEVNTNEKMIYLTECGKKYVDLLLADLVRIEKLALEKTLQTYSEDFIEALEKFTEQLEVGLGMQ